MDKAGNVLAATVGTFATAAAVAGIYKGGVGIYNAGEAATSIAASTGNTLESIRENFDTLSPQAEKVLSEVSTALEKFQSVLASTEKTVPAISGDLRRLTTAIEKVTPEVNTTLAVFQEAIQFIMMATVLMIFLWALSVFQDILSKTWPMRSVSLILQLTVGFLVVCLFAKTLYFFKRTLHSFSALAAP